MKYSNIDYAYVSRLAATALSKKLGKPVSLAYEGQKDEMLYLYVNELERKTVANEPPIPVLCEAFSLSCGEMAAKLSIPPARLRTDCVDSRFVAATKTNMTDEAKAAMRLAWYAYKRLTERTDAEFCDKDIELDKLWSTSWGR